MARTPEMATVAPFARLNHWEAGFCIRCNRLARIPALRRYFSLVSRLGDGMAWYALLITLPMAGGTAALGPSFHMALTGIVGVVVYKLIKAALNRERPFAAYRSVKALLPPLDQYSFPSGHTLQAALFTVMVAGYYPVLLLMVVPFAVSVALSRVMLGLHYPTDILAGGALGGLIGCGSMALITAFPGSI